MKTFSALALALTSTVSLFFFGKDSKTVNNNTTIKSETTVHSPSKELTQFEKFLKGFKRKEVPFEVIEEDLSPYYYTEENLEKNKKEAIPKEFSRAIPEVSKARYSRMPMDVENYYFANISSKDQAFTTILYLSSRHFKGYQGYEYKSVYCKLVTFDQQGKVIDKNVVAGVDDKGLHTLSVDQDRVFTQKQYEYTFDEGAKQIKKKLITTEQFYLNDEGKIVKVQDGQQI